MSMMGTVRWVPFLARSRPSKGLSVPPGLQRLLVMVLIACTCTSLIILVTSHSFAAHKHFDKASQDGDVVKLNPAVERQKEIIMGKLNSPYNEGSLLASGDLLANMGHLHTASKDELACRLKSLQLGLTVNTTTPPFSVNHSQAHLFPKKKFLNGKKLNTCAVVSNAATLLGSRLGSFIDSHDMVVRMNGAVTSGFEEDVGSKTTVRIVNRFVVHDDAHGFQNFGHNETQSTSLLLVETMCETMDRDPTECFVIESEDRIRIKVGMNEPFLYDTLIRYFERRKARPEEDIHIMDFSLPQKVWQVLQEFSSHPIPQHAPSTGFLGLLAMLDKCDAVNAFEFIPSLFRDTTVTECHYWDVVSLQEVSANHLAHKCAFEQFHPLKTEKLLLLRLNTGSDEQVFRQGFVSLQGLKTYDCEGVTH